MTDADDSGWENNKTNNSFTLIYVSNALPDRLAVVQELDKTIYKFVWKNKCPRIFKKVMRKIRCRLSLPDTETYYQTIVIKTVWHWHRNRKVD